MDEESSYEHLTKMRQALDEIDRRLAQVVGERFNVIKEIGLLKRDAGIPMMQPKRVDLVLARAARLESEFDIPSTVLAKVFSVLIQEACTLEDSIIASDSMTEA